MLTMNDDTREKATAILKQLKGMSMAEARDLLDWCGNYLMEEITVDFRKSKTYLKERSEEQGD